MTNSNCLSILKSCLLYYFIFCFTGAKNGDDSSALLNGNGTATVAASTGTGFCIPTGVMIPVALSATEAVAASSSSPATASTTSSSYELQRNAAIATMPTNLKNSSVNSPAGKTSSFSLSFGLIWLYQNRIFTCSFEFNKRVIKSDGEPGLIATFHHDRYFNLHSSVVLLHSFTDFTLRDYFTD